MLNAKHISTFSAEEQAIVRLLSPTFNIIGLGAGHLEIALASGHDYPYRIQRTADAHAWVLNQAWRARISTPLRWNRRKLAKTRLEALQALLKRATKLTQLSAGGAK